MILLFSKLNLLCRDLILLLTRLTVLSRVLISGIELIQGIDNLTHQNLLYSTCL